MSFATEEETRLRSASRVRALKRRIASWDDDYPAWIVECVSSGGVRLLSGDIFDADEVRRIVDDLAQRLSVVHVAAIDASSGEVQYAARGCNARTVKWWPGSVSVVRPTCDRMPGWRDRKEAGGWMEP